MTYADESRVCLGCENKLCEKDSDGMGYLFAVPLPDGSFEEVRRFFCGPAHAYEAALKA